MPRRKKGNSSYNQHVSEAVKIAVEATIRKFLNTEDAKEWEYPSSFNSAERKYIHLEAHRYGLKSKSRGNGDNRYLTIYKREGSAIVQKDATLSMTPAARTLLISLFNKQPVTTKERQDCSPPLERTKDSFQDGREGVGRAIGRLTGGIPQVPSSSTNKAYTAFRASLPIASMKEVIIQTITDNQVCIISGPTGSGKTTQVPQYILEYHERIGRPCRVVMTQPRRISAVSVCERVALERAEKLGHAIGYQIRLEGKVSPYTMLTFCTVGVLVRSLMSSDGALASVTHVIVDEVHERDRLTDFLLLVLREALAKHRSVRLVLMSATAHTNQLATYFSNCPVVSTTSGQRKWFEVKEFYLDDILRMTNYMSSEMEKLRKQLMKKKSQAAELEKWKEARLGGVELTDITPSQNVLRENTGEVNNIDMENALFEAWSTGSHAAFSQMLNLILSETVSVDYQHNATGITSLMVAVAHGNIDVVEQLLQLGASLAATASNNFTALDFAREFNQPQLHLLLKQHQLCEEEVDLNAEKQAEKDAELLNLYYTSFGYDKIDVRLIVALISYILSESNKGAILVFLPGYDDIMLVKEHLLLEEKKLSAKGKIIILTLHSNMQTGDQKLVFKSYPGGSRKIILSTNIAETSITIDDVVFIIDSGKVKEKMYNSITGASQLTTIWASKSCAEQRKGRAGRIQPGICYRLYTQARFNAMQLHRTPELLRVPIPDLCLFAKLLAPPNTSIVDFLSKALDPPSSLTCRSAVALLKTIDALDTWEDLTDLGHHLLELPVDPKYGKMLIYASLLKCLDPVLTIVCCLSYSDLFQLPSQPEKRKAASEERLKFSAGSLSDHMTLLRVFQGWQEARRQGRERAFCRDHFVSGATMEMVLGTRAQVLAQLRSTGFIRAKGPGDIKTVNSNSDNWAVVKAAITAGLYPNVARLDREHNVLRTQKEAKVGIHTSSVLREYANGKTGKINPLMTLPSDWLVYEDMTRSGRSCQIRTATAVSPITIAVFAGPAKIPLDAFSDTQLEESSGSDSEEDDIASDQTAQVKLDEWIMFRMDSESAQLALQLRIKWHALLIKKLRFSHKLLNPIDDSVVSTIVRVLSSEEQAVGLKQPAGVGRRPYLNNTPDSSNLNSNHMGDSSPELDQEKMRSTNSPSKQNFDRMNGVKMSEGEASVSPFESSDMSRSNKALAQCRFFVIKAGHLKSIEASIEQKVWSFLPNTYSKIVQAYKSGKSVILVYSMQGSGHWQGYARLMGDRAPDRLQGSGFQSGCLPVEWVRHGYLPYLSTKHLTNPYNDNAKVQTSRDGQELEPAVGEALCQLWECATLHQINRNAQRQNRIYHNSNMKG